MWLNRFRLRGRPGLICVLIAGGICCSVRPAAAQNNMPDADVMYRQLDTNQDGKLTMSDAGQSNRRMLEQIFEMASKPTSGTVTRAEFQRVFERHRAGRGGETPRERQPLPSPEERELPPLLRQLDGDHDERISRAELNRLNQLFDRLDTNRDGFLDREEMDAAARPEDANPTAERANSDRASRSTSATNSRATAAGSRPAGPNSTAETGSRSDTRSGRLQGVWRGWVVQNRGENPQDQQMEIELTITADRITGRELGGRRPGGQPGGMEALGSGNYNSTGQTTGNLDADGTSGPQDGRHFLGIYELNGDTLRWCVSNRGRQRPTALLTERGNYLMILRRQAQP